MSFHTESAQSDSCSAILLRLAAMRAMVVAIVANSGLMTEPNQFQTISAMVLTVLHVLAIADATKL